MLGRIAKRAGVLCTVDGGRDGRARSVGAWVVDRVRLVGPGVRLVASESAAPGIFRCQALHLRDRGRRRRQRHRRRVVEEDVKVDIRRRLRACLRHASDRQRALAQHLREDGVDGARVGE